MKIIREQEPEGSAPFLILQPAIGDAMARAVVKYRNGKDRKKPFDKYRATLTLAVFMRASNPWLAAWEYIHRDENKAHLTLEYLRAVLIYDPETGLFTSRLPLAKRQEGVQLGSLGNHGYLEIAVAGRNYLAHRLAWFYVYGEWPNQVDHTNRNRTNNRLANLRECTNQENNWNKAGAVGATWNAHRKRWVAKITHNSKSRTLGYFRTLEEAQASYRAEAARLRGYFLQEVA